MQQDFYSLALNHSGLIIQNTLNLIIPTKPITTNHATKQRRTNKGTIFFKTDDFKHVEKVTFGLMSANKSCHNFKNDFKQKHHGIFACWNIHVPTKHFYDAKGLIPLRKHDVDNFVKPIKDIVFKWLGFDDAHVLYEFSSRKESERWGYEIILNSFESKKKES